MRDEAEATHGDNEEHDAVQCRKLWISGATRGIGAALAGALTDDYEVTALARELGHDLSLEATARHLLSTSATPYAWIHTPGAFFEKPLLETSDVDWVELFESNVMSFVRSARSVLPAMAANGAGRVLVFGVAGLTTGTAKARAPVYFAAKAALLECVRALARDFAEAGICINMISPGAIAHADSHAASQARVASRIPAGRLGRPDDFVGLVRFLLSESSAYVTGQDIAVDGGLALANPSL